MAARQLKILLLMDLSVPIAPEEYVEYLKTEEWKTEAHVISTLQKLGHEVRPFGIYDDIDPLIHEIKNNRPDVVFNLSEAFDKDRRYEPHIVSLLELFKLPYTGAGPEPLRLCKDKGLTKKILSFHRLQVPKFMVSQRSRPIRSLKGFEWPAFIKPLNLEGSEGIAQLSFADNEKDAIERVRYIHEKLGTDAIIEEYIEGRELYVGVLGNERLQAFPPRELFFREVPEGEPKFATFRAKWDEAYRKKWGIDSGAAKVFPEGMDVKIEETCKKIYRLLQLKGYGRIDLRIKSTGEIVFIEANPNPSIAKDDDFAKSAAKAGLDYDELLSKIVSLSGV
jgi:D-alanine-D-alanine ligase